MSAGDPNSGPPPCEAALFLPERLPGPGLPWITGYPALLPFTSEHLPEYSVHARVYVPSFDLFLLEHVGKEPSILLFPGIYLKPCLVIQCQVCLQALPVPAQPYHMAAHSKAGSAFHCHHSLQCPRFRGRLPFAKKVFPSTTPRFRRTAVWERCCLLAANLIERDFCCCLILLLSR